MHVGVSLKVIFMEHCDGACFIHATNYSTVTQLQY